MRKSRAATLRNKAQRSALRTAVRRARQPEASPEDRLSAVSLLDRAARKGLIHRAHVARGCGVRLHRGQLAAAPLAIPLGWVVHRAALGALERFRLLGGHVTKKCGH